MYAEGARALRNLRYQGLLKETIAQAVMDDGLTPKELSMFERALTHARLRNKKIPVITGGIINPKPRHRLVQTGQLKAKNAYTGEELPIKRVRDLTDEELRRCLSRKREYGRRGSVLVRALKLEKKVRQGK